MASRSIEASSTPNSEYSSTGLAGMVLLLETWISCSASDSRPSRAWASTRSPGSGRSLLVDDGADDLGDAALELPDLRDRRGEADVRHAGAHLLAQREHVVDLAQLGRGQVGLVARLDELRSPASTTSCWAASSLGSSMPSARATTAACSAAAR